MKFFITIIGICLSVFHLNGQDNSLNIPPAKRNIVLAGSSITWAYGSITSRFPGEVVDFIQNECATTLLSSEMSFSGSVEVFNNPLQYKGTGEKVSGINSKIEFDLFGDEIAICQTILRTTDYAVVRVKADGEIIGRFANHNNSVGNEKQQFAGDGKTVKFKLNHPATYSHNVEIDGQLQKGKIHTGGWSRNIPENPGYLIIRKLDENRKPVHFIWFKTAPAKGAKIIVDYKFGRVVAFEGSTVGQLATDETNESAYGEGTVSFDPANPAVLSSGLEYRYIDQDAFWVHKFTSAKKRHFEIEIIDGVNPYFIINFASNRFHNFMNAGIGGWRLSYLLDKDGINDYNAFFEKFTPDVLVNESATNDDWAFGERKVKRTLTGLSEKEVKQLWTLELDSVSYNKTTDDYTVRLCTGIISSASRFALTCPQIVNSTVSPGDIIRIGTYHGDNHQVVCREIETVDLQKGEVTWLNPLAPEQLLNVNNFSDLTGAECAVRSLAGYQNQYEELIRNIQKISPQTQLLIAQPGLSNYRRRALWGYNIIHRKLAAQFHNVNTIEITDWLYDYQQGNISGKSFVEIDADGNSEYILPWDGHWQGFEVWVDNKNVYGTDCYIECGFGYSVNQDGTGSELNIENSYNKSHSVKRKMKLVFTKNAPQKGVIKIVKADSVWSPDFCHTTGAGGYVYGQIYNSEIGKLIK